MANAPTTTPTSMKATAQAGGPQVKATQQAARPPAFMITPVKQRQRYLKLLVYGNYGVGKTYLAGTASLVPEMHHILMINAEGGDLTLDEFEGIDQASATTFNQLGRIYEFLVAHCRARDADKQDELKEYQERLFGMPVSDKVPLRKYKTVIIDSLTEVNQYCLNQLLGVQESTKIDEDPVAAEFKEYKQNNTMMLRFVRKFRDLPLNVIFTAAEDFVQDEMKRRFMTPAMTGKLSKQIQGFMDMVGYYVQGTPTEEQAGQGVQVPRRLYVLPNQAGKHDAKHRYSKFKKPYFDNPTIASILKETGLLEAQGAQVS